MKLLFDQNLSFRLCTDLADLFPGSTHVRLIGLAEATDRDIWQFATENGYTIVSQDADFAEMGVLLPVPPKVICCARETGQARRLQPCCAATPP